jgi:hypothetical protein
MNARLLHHALQRITLRTSLTEADVQRVLTHRLCVPLGYEPNSDRTHMLFWSEQDQDCFIAVVDERAAEVVTILPLAYENRFRLSLESVELAQRLWREWEAAQAAQRQLEEQRAPALIKAATPASSSGGWQLAAQVIEACGGLKMKNLGRFKLPSALNLDGRERLVKEHIAEQLRRRDIGWGRVTYVRAKTRSGAVHVVYRNRWAEVSVKHGVAARGDVSEGKFSIAALVAVAA